MTVAPVDNTRPDISKPIIGIIGNGVVGSATGKCYEAHNHQVRYFDLDPFRSTNTLGGVLQSDIIYICLPTPSKPNFHGLDTTALDNLFTKIVDYNSPPQWKDCNLVIRSTVPIGYTRSIHVRHSIPNLVHSPEFLTARTASQDALNPRLNIVGNTESNKLSRGSQRLIELYLSIGHLPTKVMTSTESEAVKLFMNTFFATKVALFNELRTVADAKSLDWETIRRALVEEGRVGDLHTHVPGPDGSYGFGGACLPKDLAEFVQTCVNLDQVPLVSRGAMLRNTVDRVRKV